MTHACKGHRMKTDGTVALTAEWEMGVIPLFLLAPGPSVVHFQIFYNKHVVSVSRGNRRL